MHGQGGHPTAGGADTGDEQQGAGDDVLRACLAVNPAVRNELAGPMLRRVLARRAPHVYVDAVDGVVTLTGSTERRSTAHLAVGLDGHLQA